MVSSVNHQNRFRNKRVLIVNKKTTVEGDGGTTLDIDGGDSSNTGDVSFDIDGGDS